MSLTECVENLSLQDCQRFFSTLMDSSAKKDEETVSGDDSMTCDGTEVEDIDAKACMECLRTQSGDIEVIPKICMLALRALQQSKSSSGELPLTICFVMLIFPCRYLAMVPGGAV